MLTTGEVFAGYAIERQLGRGGMGSVYLARHPRLPRQTALKLLNPELFADNEIRARFEREADLAAQLEHPNIVTVYDRGVDDGRLWISMQFVDGVDAATIEHPVPADSALHIIEATAAALDHAHRNGVLHRDVKPANILLADTDGRERVLLTDFGIARPRDDVHHLTQTGSFTATLAYAAPEQLTGAHLDHRVDQYSLACTLYSLLTGAAPFEATNPVQVIQGHLQSPPPSLRTRRPDLPAALDAVLARALSKRAADRFDSCAEFAAAARRALSGTGAQPTVFAAQSMPQFQQANPYMPARPRSVPQPRLPQGPVGAPVWQPSQGSPRPAGNAVRSVPVRGRRTSRGIAPAVLLVVLAVVIGVGYWGWRDESTFVAEILNRTRAHKDIAALSEAFPQLLPSGEVSGLELGNPYIQVVGFGGRTCSAYVNTTTRGELGWEMAFQKSGAKWACTGPELSDTDYSVHAFATAADAAEAVSRFRNESIENGETSTGSRTDRQLVQGAVDNYYGSAVVSTFSDKARERWVLVFHRGSPFTKLEADMPALLAEIDRFDLN
ncbi:serine/threonine-protein kinase [Nocardia sp. NPDC058658]|uniref:serine/threonine-protein kinase n=1 Tax=Nocardia sp. NPDC058658 TaxID=3346580 RepID=UPI0036683BC8